MAPVIHQVTDADGNLVAEFEDPDAAERYVEGASGGPFTVKTASESQIPGATADDA